MLPDSRWPAEHSVGGGMQSNRAVNPELWTLESEVSTTIIRFESVVVVVGGVEVPVADRSHVAPVEVDQCDVTSYIFTQSKLFSTLKPLKLRETVFELGQLSLQEHSALAPYGPELQEDDGSMVTAPAHTGI